MLPPFQAVTANGESVVSNGINVDTKPVASVASSATDIQINSFKASWQAVSGATSYFLFVWKKEGMQFVSGYNGKTINGLQEIVIPIEEM